MRRKFLFLTVLSVGLGAFGFLHAGTFLAVSDSFSHADLALVLSGEPVGRTLAARDLYKKGLVDKILVIPEPASPLDRELILLGLSDPKLPPLSRRILTASGISASRVTFLSEPAEGTIHEALAVRKFFRGRFPESIVLVTSKFSSRRARFIFRKLLQKEGVRVYAFANPQDPFEPTRWWQRPRNALQVVNEYLKLLSNALALAFAV